MSPLKLLPLVLALAVCAPSVQTLFAGLTRETTVPGRRPASLFFQGFPSRLETSARRATEVETDARLGLRLGHLVRVNEVALSPDGTTLATAGVGDIKFWDVATGGPRRARIPQSSWKIAFSPDGRTLVVIPTPADVELWDVESGRLLKRMTDSGAPEHEILRQLQFAPDGRTVVLGGDDRTAVFDATSGLLKQALPGGSVAFSGDARTFAYANHLRNDVVLYDLATMTVQKTITERLGTVETVCVSPDGGRLAMGIRTSQDGIVALADTGTSTILWSRTVRNGGDPENVSCSADGQTVAALFRRGVVLFDAATGEQRVWLPCGEVIDGIRDIASTAFSPDGRSFTLVSDLRKTYQETETTLEVFVWDTRTGAVARPPISRKSHLASAGGKTWILFSSNGERLLATSYVGGLTLLNAINGAERWSIVPAREPEFLTISSDGTRVLSGWKTTFSEALNLERTHSVFPAWNLEAWDAASGTPLDAVSLRQFDIRPLPDGRTLAVIGVPPDALPPAGRPAGADKDLRLFAWDMATRTRGWTQKAVTDWLVVSSGGRTVAVSEEEKSVRSFITLRDTATGKSSRCVIKTALFARFAVSFDASLLASAETTGATLWNVATCRSIRNLEGLPGGPHWLTFSPDGRFLAGGRRDSAQSTIWDLATGQALRTLDGVKGDFSVGTRVDAPDGVFSPDAKMMALATGDGNAVLIDVESGSLRWVFPEAQPPFAFSPNGKVLWTAGSGVIKAWQVSDGSLLVSRVILPRGDASSGHDWLAFTPQGHYDGTPESERYIVWRDGDHFSLPPVFRERFRSADRLREALEAGQSRSGP